MMILYDNDIPYGFQAGNHDDKTFWGDWIGNEYKAFNPDILGEKEYWGGEWATGQSNYQLMTIRGRNYIFLI